MDTDWSVEAGQDDPVIVVPWRNGPPGTGDYVELGDEPARIDSIPEAQRWPEVRKALLVLNAHGSPVSTVKCDAWMLAQDELLLDFGPAAFGFGAYFDVTGRDGCALLAALRSRVERWSAAARGLAPEHARADFVVRSAQVHGESGYAVTVYVFGYGQSETEARANWSAACDAVARLVTCAH